ncbi:MAG: cytochrome c biogenesis protein CcsA [Reichenbachiella sp.]
MTIVLLLVFAISMAYATFVENDFGTNAVRLLIYDAWWFEMVMVLLSINFIANISRYKLWRKEKRSVFLFHVAFIIVIAGAFVTRYFGEEGMMRIREGSSSNQVISEKRYLTVDVTNETGFKSNQKLVRTSILKKPDVQMSFGADSNLLEITTKKYVPNAVQTLVQGNTDDAVLEIVISHEGIRKDLFLPSLGYINLAHGRITFNNPEEHAINLVTSGDSILIHSPDELSYLRMSDQQAGKVEAGTSARLMMRSLYQVGDVSFVVSQKHLQKKIQYIPAQDEEMEKTAADLLMVELKSGEYETELKMAAVDGVYSMPQEIEINGHQVSINYGPKLIDLSFSIQLNDFQLVRYPGSTSPSSYASEVTVLEGEDKMPYRIYMNNVLDYGGYRFFQASYDMDELGTVLSVNKDRLGTNITYIGYTLLFICMIWTLFGKSSRFQFVAKRLKSIQNNSKIGLVLFLLFVSKFAFAENKELAFTIDSMHIIPVEHAKQFGSLLVQDMDGRIKPLNTLTSEFTRKMYRSTKLKLPTATGEKLNSDQVFLSLNIDPYYWRDVPIIKIDPMIGAPILELLEMKSAKYLCLMDLIDSEGNYVLAEWVDLSSRKKPVEQSNFDKEVIKIDERFNVLFQALDGYYLKLFPKKGDPDNSWYDYKIGKAGFEKEDSLFVASIIPMYYQSIIEAQQSGDWDTPNKHLKYIKTYQDVLGADVNPTDGRRKGELLYNRLGLFTHLFGAYWLIGLTLMVLVIWKVLSPANWIEWTLKILIVLTIIAFLTQTFNMILRWYAADYPPWSNGYEMIILVSWFLMLFGIVFHRSSDFVLPLATLFTGTLLFVAFIDWLNPEITNLVPVLKSYWLKIHVAIIVGSYAPLALSALLGLMTLIIMLFPKHNELQSKTKELTYINELSMIIGIFMLTIGTFLGGIWANESWGRYWGWDPKETWALISVMVYAVVLHLRLIPGMNTQYIFSTASMFAFYSIMMTSFGVNYYLTGLHSYAQGDPLPIPVFVYYVTAFLIVLSISAFFQKKRIKLEHT